MNEKRQVVSKLIKGNIQLITACFDEYYFMIPEGVIKPVPNNANDYYVGDNLPVKGATYQFPDDFNIIDLHFKLVAKVRGGELFDIVYVNDFKYDGIPSVNMMGFGIKIENEEDYESFKKHFSSFSLTERVKLANFANRWLNITRFRMIQYL